jgi:hypothetical protein
MGGGYYGWYMRRDYNGRNMEDKKSARKYGRRLAADGIWEGEDFLQRMEYGRRLQRIEIWEGVTTNGIWKVYNG